MGVLDDRRRGLELVATAGAMVVLAAACNLGKPPVEYPVDASDSVIDGLASGDLNGDGATDLVVGTVGAYTVLLNDGAGGFTATRTPTTAPSVASVRLVDVDSDGDLDMLAHDYGNTVPGPNPEATFLFLGDGAGGFGDPTYLFDMRIAAVGDLDGDGHADLVSSSGDGFAVVRLGDGTGGFGDPASYPLPPDYTFARGGVVADLTGDGDQDVFTVGLEIACEADCTFTPYVALLTGDGTGALSAGPLVPAGTADPTVGDFDEDGNLDVVTAGAGSAASPSLSLIRTDGAGNLVAPTSIVLAKEACEVEAADIDRDGHLDLVLATAGNKATVLFGDGAGQFPATHEIATAGGAATGFPACNNVRSGLLDADAKPDVAFLGQTTDTLAVMLNRLDGRPTH